MTTVRGILRSTETREAEASASDTASARAAAIAGIDMDGYELIQAGTTSITGGQIRIRAIARAVATRDHEATGPTHDAAMQAFRTTVPDGWQAQYARAID